MDIAQEFMEKTKYRYLAESDQGKGLPQPPLESEYDLQKPRIKLPRPAELNFGQKALIDVINGRRSLRQYSGEPLTLQELSYLLWCTQGVRRFKEGVASYRSVPSAGARHAFDTWLLVNRVEGVEPGLYRFLAFEHQLVEADKEADITEKIVAGCMGQGFVGGSAATFIWVADAERMKWRYGVRGYRYLHLDAGHVCENLYLAAESIDGGACAIAAFDDDVINEVLRLDGEKQFVIYVAAVGKKGL
jgi:SagB-type dehydrogenase family enzyme